MSLGRLCEVTTEALTPFDGTALTFTHTHLPISQKRPLSPFSPDPLFPSFRLAGVVIQSPHGSFRGRQTGEALLKVIKKYDQRESYDSGMGNAAEMVTFRLSFEHLTGYLEKLIRQQKIAQRQI